MENLSVSGFHFTKKEESMNANEHGRTPLIDELFSFVSNIPKFSSEPNLFVDVLQCLPDTNLAVVTVQNANGLLQVAGLRVQGSCNQT